MGGRAFSLRVTLTRRLRMVRVHRPGTSMGQQFETPASADYGLSQAFTSCLHMLAIFEKLAQNRFFRLPHNVCFTGFDV